MVVLALFPAFLSGEIRVEVQKSPFQVTLQGEFQGYEQFSLSLPSRFVVDLVGARYSGMDEIPVGVQGVVRVRIAQHAVQPRPVVRVVLDLEKPARFEVRESGQGQLVILPATAQAPAPVAPAQPAATPTRETGSPQDTLEARILKLKNPPPVQVVRLGRDPFEPPDPSEDTLLVPQRAILLGIVKNDAGEKFALLTDGEQNYVLREGDPVAQGRLARIGEDFVVFSIYEYGVARAYRVKLSARKEK